MRKAVEIQQKNQGNTPGLTEEEIIGLAAESGISPDAVAKAIAGVNEATITATSTRNDTHPFETRDIQPPAGSKTVWPEIVDKLRHHFGTSLANIQHNAEGREWIHTSAMGVETRVSISEGSSRTRVRLSQRVGAAGPVTEALMYGLMLSGVASFFAVKSAGLTILEGVQLFAALGVIGSAGVFLLDRIWRNRKTASLRGLADRIAQIVGSGESNNQWMAENDSSAIKENQIPIRRIQLEDLLVEDEPRGSLHNVLKKRG